MGQLIGYHLRVLKIIDMDAWYTLPNSRNLNKRLLIQQVPKYLSVFTIVVFIDINNQNEFLINIQSMPSYEIIFGYQRTPNKFADTQQHHRYWSTT